jgi:hypothetical protein
MKISKVLTFVFGAALLFSSSAIAGGTNNKTSLQLDDKIVVDGKSVDTGKYTAEWTGTGSTVQVTLFQGKQAVATFPAHLAEQASANTQAAYSTTTAPDGSKALTAIYPGGKHLVLQIAQNQSSQSAN